MFVQSASVEVSIHDRIAYSLLVHMVALMCLSDLEVGQANVELAQVGVSQVLPGLICLAELSEQVLLVDPSVTLVFSPQAGYLGVTQEEGLGRAGEYCVVAEDLCCV